MKRIENAAIVGMGALGMMYGERIVKNLGADRLCYLMDDARWLRHRGETCTVNGEEMHFEIRHGDGIEPADLVIVATKYGGLREAMELMRPAVGADTVIISVLNGISSEEILSEQYDRRNIIDCVPIGMDAMRDGRALTYKNVGRLQIGIKTPEQEVRLRALEDFFTRAGIPFETVPDIARAMWNKFMINVGINQTCMVYETTYAGATSPGKAYDDLVSAMREVICVAEKEGIALTEADLEADMALLRSLNPDGYPSMRQDAVAGRRSEVELFAGTIVRLADKHGLDVPVNRRYYDTILEMEKDLKA